MMGLGGGQGWGGGILVIIIALLLPYSCQKLIIRNFFVIDWIQQILTPTYLVLYVRRFFMGF